MFMLFMFIFHPVKRRCSPHSGMIAETIASITNNDAVGIFSFLF